MIKKSPFGVSQQADMRARSARDSSGDDDPAAGGQPDGAKSRIAKIIARSGFCSRREAERLIANGRVSVNGAPLTTAAFLVGAGDDVRIDGQPVTQTPATRLWRYHKPGGLITSHKDPQGRTSVFDRLPDEFPRVISVGRLDITSEGLLLLTNDGGLARHLELPSTGWRRRYRVRAHGRIDESKLAELRGGVRIDGTDYRAIDISLERQIGHNNWLSVGLREGKNREIRKLFTHVGLEVNRLIRISYGPFVLGNLKRGSVEEINPKVIREQIGARYEELVRNVR